MLHFLIISLALIIALSLLWRLGSQRHYLPCPSWLGWMVEMDNPFTSVNRAATIIEHLKVQKGMTILDIGCGPGRVSIPLAQAVGPTGIIVALDTQKAMLKKVEKKAAQNELNNIELVQATIGTSSHTITQKFDRITLITVLGEIPNQKAAFVETTDLLKPDGILSVTELVFDPHFQPRTTVRTLATQTGLKEVSCFGSWYAYTMHLVKKKS